MNAPSWVRWGRCMGCGGLVKLIRDVAVRDQRHGGGCGGAFLELNGREAAGARGRAHAVITVAAVKSGDGSK